MSLGGMVSIKWTAPEAVLFMMYSTASDVWSYGCLPECNPFEGLTNNEVIIYWCKHASSCCVQSCIQTVCLPLKAIQKVNTGYILPPTPMASFIDLSYDDEMLVSPPFKYVIGLANLLAIQYHPSLLALCMSQTSMIMI